MLHNLKSKRQSQARSAKPRRMMTPLLLAILSSMVCYGGVHARSTRALDKKSNTSLSSLNRVRQAEDQQGRPDEVRVELSPNGFNPSSLTHAAGQFSIMIDNQGVEGEYTLQLKNADGSVLKEVPVQKGSPGFSVDLQAGEYTLSVVNQTSWVCHITVQ